MKGNMPLFTNSDRVRALHAAADWCRQGAPGGNTGQVFSEQGPCALGKALLELHNDLEDWLDFKYDAQTSDCLTGGNQEAALALHHVPGAFDTGNLGGAAHALELAASHLVPA